MSIVVKTRAKGIATQGGKKKLPRATTTSIAKDKFYSLLRLRKFLRWLDQAFISSVRCCLFYDELRHKSREEKLYKAIGCQDRATCPICGASYWKQKGFEGKSLFLAQRDKLLFEGSDLNQWLLDFEFTIPVILSELIDDMDLRGKRVYLNKLSRACYKVLNEVLGSDIGGVAIIHFWHSKNPLYSYYHWHLIVSPFNAQGGLVFEDPYLPGEKLEELREKWREKVSRVFSIDFKQSFNVHYEYVKEGREASKKFNHRFNYCFRHWTGDILKYRGKIRKKAVARAIIRARELEGIKKIRWFGYLSTLKRKDAGFDAVENQGDLFACPKCSQEFEQEQLIDVLSVGVGWKVETPCGHIFEGRQELKKVSAWEQTGKTFVLRHFRKNGVILAEWDNEKCRIIEGSDVLVPFSQVDLFPFKGKKKRFICRSP